MTEKIPHPAVHESYLRHRKEMTWQIIAPIVVTFLVLIALIVLISLATFRNNGDVARWAAISEIWIVIPIMIGLLIFITLLAGLVYLLAKLLHIMPRYTGLAQDYVYVAEIYIKRALDAVVKQVIDLQGAVASIQRFFEKLKP